MYEFLWFLAGCAFVFLLLLWGAQRYRGVRRFCRARIWGTQGANGEPAPESRTARSIDAIAELFVDRNRAERLETLATSIGREVADLTSSVESTAQLLIEEIDSSQLPSERTEDLSKAVRRMRFFIHKLLSFAETEPLQLGATDVTKLLVDLRKELKSQSPDGLKIEVVTASALPLAMAEETSLHNALLFLVQALLDLEPSTSELCLHARTGVDQEETPTVEIEIQVVSDDGRTVSAPSKEHLQIDFAAARNLLRGQGATLSLDHTPGLNATVYVCLAATTRSLPTSPFGPPPAADRHGFGGVLVLEDDPSIRAIVSGELRATDRNIFACTDGASARSLFSATPERFELLILERAARLERGDQIALDAMRINPDVKVLLMSAGIHAGLDFPKSYRSRLRILRKPFGIDELRMAIRSLLGTQTGSGRER